MTHVLITTHVSLLSDPLSISRSLKFLINKSIADDYQVLIFQTISLPRVVTLLQSNENDENKLLLVVWLLAHLALKEENGNLIIECEEIINLLCTLLSSNNQLLVTKTLWLLNNLSLVEKSFILSPTVGQIVNCMKVSARSSNMEHLLMCGDIILNLCHKDSCLTYLHSQSEFVGAKGLETLLEITVGMDGNLDAMNIVSSLLEIISAYQVEWRNKIMQVGMLPLLVRIAKNQSPNYRIAREQAMKSLFNLSFLAGNRDFDIKLVKSDCLEILLESILRPNNDHDQKLSVSILANLLVSEIVRNDVKSSQLAEAISAVARHVTEDQLLTLPSLIAAIANAAIHDGCKEELRKCNIEEDLNRFSQKCHPATRTIIFAAQDNMKLEGNKSPPAYMDLNGNSIGFVNKLLDKRSSLAPSSKRDIKPKLPVPKNSIAEILCAAVPKRQMSRFLSGIVENSGEWDD